MKLSDWMSSYERDAGITIHSSRDGYICHGIAYPDIRNESWYDKYKDEFVIHFKVTKDEKIGEEVLFLSM